jgi:hypothetical protein
MFSLRADLKGTMKKTLQSPSWLRWTLFGLVMAVALRLWAADPAPVPAPDSNPLFDLLNQWLGATGLSLAAIIGSLRLFLKPLYDAVHLFVEKTPATRDDVILAKLETSLAFKAFWWALDYFASIKLGSQRPVPAVPVGTEVKVNIGTAAGGTTIV